jgi:hypothetical protein
MKTMKTMIIFLSTLLILNTSLIFAHTPGEIKSEPIKMEMTVGVDKLIPVMPILVEFTDGTDYLAMPDAMIMKLAPFTPKEADFEDSDFLSPVNIEKLAPETPKESDFEDVNFLNSIVPAKLAPTTPAEADFSA